MSDTPPEVRALGAIPSALDHFAEVADALNGRTLFLFLDFDGTLAPIMPTPEAAEMPPAARRVVESLAALTPVAILSGRERTDVESRVGVPGAVFAGSHGLDIEGPDFAHRVGEDARPALERAQSTLEPLGRTHAGVRFEPKRFGLAVHYRLAENDAFEALEKAVGNIALQEPTLRMVYGKQVLELRPDVPWDKGSALGLIRARWAQRYADGMAMYLGDDVTDEDAFRALGPAGLSIVVRGEDDARMSGARFALEGPPQVPLFLSRVLERIERGPPTRKQ